MYQPALRDALGSDLRLQNTMESFALAHCLMAGGEGGSVSNIVGKAPLGDMMRNLAAARLIEGNVLGEDGRDLADPSSVRTAWFASQPSQDAEGLGGADADQLTAYLVLKRADAELAAGEAPGTVLEMQLQARRVVMNAYSDQIGLTVELVEAGEGVRLSDVSAALRAVYEGSAPEARFDNMDALMSDPAGAVRKIEAAGLEAYLSDLPSRSSLDRVEVTDPFGAPVMTASLAEVEARNPFKIRPEADVSLKDGPRP